MVINIKYKCQLSILAKTLFLFLMFIYVFISVSVHISYLIDPTSSIKPSKYVEIHTGYMIIFITHKH